MTEFENELIKAAQLLKKSCHLDACATCPLINIHGECSLASIYPFHYPHEWDIPERED